MLGIIGTALMIAQISAPINKDADRDRVPFAGWMPEIVVTAPRYCEIDEDSIPYIGMMPELVVTAPRYYGEGDESIRDDDITLLKESRQSSVKDTASEEKGL